MEQQLKPSKNYYNSKNKHKIKNPKSDPEQFDSKSDVKFMSLQNHEVNSNSSNNNNNTNNNSDVNNVDEIDDFYLISSNAFRPSIVKKRVKTPIENSRSGTNISIQLNKNIRGGGVVVIQDEPEIIFYDNHNNIDQIESHLFEIDSNESRSNSSNRIMNKTDSTSLMPKNTTNSNKTTIDLFKEVFDNVYAASTTSTNMSLNQKTQNPKLFKSKSFLDLNMSTNSNKNEINNSNASQNENEQTDVYNNNKTLNDLDENEFLELLKEYRKTKALNLNKFILPNNSIDFNANRSNNLNAESNSSITNKSNKSLNSNISLSELKIPSQILTYEKSATLTNFLPNLSQFKKNDSSFSPLIPSNNATSNSSMSNYTDNFQINNSIPNTKNLYVNKMTPSSNYLFNYLNKKLLIKNSTNLIDATNRMRPKENNRAYNELNIKGLTNSNINNNHNNNKHHNSNNKNTFHHKITNNNFPEVAN
jgi:hypothetical protein